VELKEFIKESLIQIAEGIEAAQTEVRDCGGFVNPAHRTNSKESHQSHFGSLSNGQNIFLVDFNVAVNVAEDSGTNASAKIKVASLLELGAGGKSNNSSSASSKIEFKVPLALPVDSISEENLKAQDQQVIEKRKQQREAIRNRKSFI